MYKNNNKRKIKDIFLTTNKNDKHNEILKY